MSSQQPINVVVAVNPGLLGALEKHQPRIKERLTSDLARESGYKLVELIHPLQEIQNLNPKPRRIVIVSCSESWHNNFEWAIDRHPEFCEIPRTLIPVRLWENQEANVEALLRIVRDPMRES